jgi:hypothetical protein
VKLKPIICTITIISSLSSSLYASVENETRLYHLLHPSFEELMSEIVEQKITNYIDIPEEVIEEALDNQFYRIEYMLFSNQK